MALWKDRDFLHPKVLLEAYYELKTTIPRREDSSSYKSPRQS
jgi:hypothetical protein